jgi:hypothetical protein
MREVAVGSAAAFVLADLLAVRAGQPPIYLADAAVECLFILASRAPSTSGRAHPASSIA